MTDPAANLKAYEGYIEVDYDEAGWEQVWTGMFAFLCSHKTSVKEAFGFDCRQSILHSHYPRLLEFACDPQIPIVYSPALREFGVIVFDGGPAKQGLEFDPWTGKVLPKSLRDEWFSAVEALGLDPWNEETKVPARFNDETWWKDSYVPEKSA
jgi:hypothetical protein